LGACLLVFAVILSVVLVVVVGRKPAEAPEPAPVPPSPQVMEEQALALQGRGEYAAAEELFRECLTERQKVLGPENIDSLAAMNNLANLLHDRGKDTEAETLHRQARMLARTLGADHPHTLASLN
jgi:hypothetical protein